MLPFNVYTTRYTLESVSLLLSVYYRVCCVWGRWSIQVTILHHRESLQREGFICGVNRYLANRSLSWILSSSILEYLFPLGSSSSDLKQGKERINKLKTRFEKRFVRIFLIIRDGQLRVALSLRTIVLSSV